MGDGQKSKKSLLYLSVEVRRLGSRHDDLWIWDQGLASSVCSPLTPFPLQGSHSSLAASVLFLHLTLSDLLSTLPGRGSTGEQMESCRVNNDGFHGLSPVVTAGRTHTPRGSEHTLGMSYMSPLLYHVHHQGAASYLSPL